MSGLRKGRGFSMELRHFFKKKMYPGSPRIVSHADPGWQRILLDENI